MTPPFAPAYTASPVEPTRPASLAMLTILPPPTSTMRGTTAWHTATIPR